MNPIAWVRETWRRWTTSPARPRQGSRLYAMAKQTRLTEGWGTSTTSEDTELASSLRTARQRSRQLIRDSALAQRAKRVVESNIVGTGIGLQGAVMNTRNKLNERINDEIETRWEEWCDADSCHTGGILAFADLERLLIGEVFEAGEIFVRLHFRPFGNSSVPLALEVIESERLADDLQPNTVGLRQQVRLGVEADAFGRPLAYWIRRWHPGDLRVPTIETTEFERVPAEVILRIRVVNRWPQTRAMPWLHAVARRLNDMDGLSEAEIIAARAAACYMGFLESPGESGMGTPAADGGKEVVLEPGVIEQLQPGEKFTGFKPDRPNSAFEPFMRFMAREVAAGCGMTYESLTRDYAQSNYSSSRLALLDDRDLWRMLQLWFIRTFRQRLHRVWLQQAVLARAIASIPLDEYALTLRKFEAVRFKPRGWSWVDPTKEIDAYRAAVRSGFTTVSSVIANTGAGLDLEDVLKERKRELQLMASMGLVFETDPAVTITENPKPQPAEATTPNPAPPEEDGEDEEEPAARAIREAEQWAQRV